MRDAHHRITALLFLIACAATSAHADGLAGRVTSVSDGDTFTMLNEADHHHLRVRLVSIDAPELDQAGGQHSRELLSNLVEGRTIRVVSGGHDHYGRLLGHVFVDGEDVNKRMLREGWAWHYRYYDTSAELAALEEGARHERRGLWGGAGEAIPPWEWRQSRRGD